MKSYILNSIIVAKITIVIIAIMFAIMGLAVCVHSIDIEEEVSHSRLTTKSGQMQFLDAAHIIEAERLGALIEPQSCNMMNMCIIENMAYLCNSNNEKRVCVPFATSWPLHGQVDDHTVESPVQ